MRWCVKVGRSIKGDLLRVVDVFVSQRLVRDAYTGLSGYIIELNLALEDGRVFTMVNIPSDVAEALKVYTEAATIPRRQSVFTFILNSETFKEALVKGLKSVAIDELDTATGLYTASVNLEDEGVNMSIKMIPSHAVYLALISGKDIYVKKSLVDQQEKFEERG